MFLDKSQLTNVLICNTGLPRRRELGHCSYVSGSRSFVVEDVLIRFVDRLLMPAFSTAKVRDMFDDMVDIAQQMVQKWERYLASCLHPQL